MFAEFFIHRPKFAIVLSILTALIGGLCLMRMPIAEYPEVAPPSVKVTATYPGASSTVVANTVAAILEEKVNGIEDMMYFSSSSDDSGNYSMVLTFEPGTDSDIATVNVQNAVQAAITSLPDSVQQIGVTTKKQNTDMVGVFSFITKDSSAFSELQVANFVRMQVKDPLARLPGMGFVEVLGQRDYSIRVWLDPVKMAALNLSPDDVVSRIRTQNLASAAGSIGTEGANTFIHIKLDIHGRLDTPEEFENIIIATTDEGAQLKLKDIARVELGAERYGDSAYYHGNFNGRQVRNQPCVSVAMYRQDGANVVELMKNARRTMAELEARFPEQVEWTCAYDPSEYIQENVSEIASTLILTLVLVILITWVFLQDWRATLIPAVAIPISLLGTFFVMMLLGYTINVLTMFGMILVIGSLVDNAIVVVENTMRIIADEKLPPMEATSKSMKQVTSPVIAATLVSVAIYAPIGFYPGIIGTIYKQFAVTMCVGLLISAFNALTLSPALCAAILKPASTRPKFFLYRIFEWFLDLTRGGYVAVAKLLVRSCLFTIIPLALCIWLNWDCLKALKGGFLPQEDKGCLLADVELAAGSSLEQCVQNMEELGSKVMEIKGVDRMLTVAGYSMLSGLGENVGMSIISLTPWGQRRAPELHIDAIRASTMAKCAEMPASLVRIFQPPAIMGLGVSGGVSFAFRTTGNDTPKEFEGQVQKLVGFLNDKSKMPDVAYAFANYNAQTPHAMLDIDREKAAVLGIDFGDITNALEGNLASKYANDFNLSGYAFKVKVQVDKADRVGIQKLEDMLVRNNRGEMVPFNAFCTVKECLGARRLERFTQNMSANVTVIPIPGKSTDSIMTQILEHVRADYSKAYDISWTDMSYQEQRNKGNIGFLMLMAVIFGYLFLVAQYESWSIPLPVMLSVLFATLGGLAALYLTDSLLDIYAQLGLIMLIGLTSKSTILMVEFAMQARNDGQPILDCAVNSIHFRLRAVLMTALSFVIGVLPMLFADGAGSESRRIIGITTFWGMSCASLVGVAFVPSMYVFFQKIREFVKGTNRKRVG